MTHAAHPAEFVYLRQRLDRGHGVDLTGFAAYSDDAPPGAVGLFLPRHEDRDHGFRPGVVALDRDLDVETVLDILRQLDAALDDHRTRWSLLELTPAGRPGMWLTPVRRRFRRSRRYW